VALSEDEGKTWHIKELTGAQRHENQKVSEAMKGSTIGYSAARQAQNGIIHLITTMNQPCLHFEMNEAWIMSENEKSDAELMKSYATSISNVRDYEEKYPSGKTRIKWSAGVADDGRGLLHGQEVWYYENAQKQREATYKLGQKILSETYWSEDGKKIWEWQYNEDGSSIWSQWRLNGKKKAESVWRDFKCHGPAIFWDKDGNIISQVEFFHGKIKR